MVRFVMVLIVACFTLGLATQAQAQIVDIQPLMSKVKEDGFHGKVGGALSWQTGNVELLLVDASLLLMYQTGIHRLLSSSAGTVGYRGKDQIKEQVFTHLRWQAQVTPWLRWETFSQVATNRFKRLALRALGGTGPRFELWDEPDAGFSIGLSYLFEREIMGEGDWSDSGEAMDNHRASVYVTGRYAFTKDVNLSHTTYFQPRLDLFIDDFRLSSLTNLGVKLTDSLALKLGFSLGYDQDPPEGVKRLDTTTKAGITYSW